MVVCDLQQVRRSVVRSFPAKVPTTVHPRLVRRSGGFSAAGAGVGAYAAAPQEAPLYLPPEPPASQPLAPLYLESEHQEAPEYLPSGVFDELLTEIFKRPEDADTEREYSHELPPLPKPKLEALRVRPRATPPAPMLRSPRSSADSIAAVRPIAIPPLDPRRVARASRKLQSQPRSSAQRPVAARPIEPARPIREAGFEAIYPRLDQQVDPRFDPRFDPRNDPRVQPAPYQPPLAPLEHQEEPLAFGGQVMRRAATAVEPAIGRSIRAPRTVLFAGSAAALVAAAIVLLAAWKIADARRVRGMIAYNDSESSVRSDAPRLGRVAIRAEESSRIRHRKSAEFRDLWRSNVWFHPLTGKMYLPENPTRKFGARRSAGDRPAECGRGHCGVDLGDFGLPVHAVRDGVIEKIQWKPKNNAGKYVRIEHDDGFTSYYIHLHKIRKDLEEGQRIEGGEQIGITGKTGIRKSRPHLHFALSYKDGREKIFIDPEPVLRRSIWSLDDSVAAETADASVVARSAAALDDDVQARREDEVHQGRHQHSAEDDRTE